MHRGGILVARLGENLNLVGNHERRVKAQTEVSDDGLILILCQELLGTREGNLVDVTLNLIGSHTNAAVGDCERMLVGIHRDMDCCVAQLACPLALRRKGL